MYHTNYLSGCGVYFPAQRWDFEVAEADCIALYDKRSWDQQGSTRQIAAWG